MTVYDASGCVYCAGRGYGGRVALFEMIPCDESMATLIAEGAGEEGIARAAKEKSRPMLIDDALAKLRSGTTAVSEVLASVVHW